jgi:L-cystine transport system permease protein
VLAVIYSLLCLIIWLIVRFFERRSPMYIPAAAPIRGAVMPSV